jgi:carbonic anhydrase
MRKFAPRFVLLLLYTFQCPLLVVAQNTTHAHEESRPAKTSADQIWASLAAGNKRFVSGKAHPHNYVEQRQALVKGQRPEVAVLSCSDSRVPPEILFDQGLGDLFVVRSAGNSADPLGVGSLEYAVEHLGSVVIVVLGHQNCGAVKAACSGEKMPSSNLDAVVQPVLPSCSAATKHGDDSLDFAVRDHVHRAAESLLANSEILKHAKDEGKLSIIEAYYELSTGRVIRLSGRDWEASQK